MDLDNLSDLILKKKSLSGLSKSVVKKEIELYLKKEKIYLENLSDKDIKIVVKQVRSKLRKLSGSFNYENQSEDLLSSHSSTNERHDFYPELISKIKSLNPKSILDLGCGLNPLAIADKNTKYYAYDINEKNLELVDSYFKDEGIDGETKVVDLRESSTFPKTDLTIMFKILDLIDEKNHLPSEMLLKRIQSKYILISFSTKTLSGAPMRHPQRGWIEHLLNRLGYSFESFSSKNEIFYLAKNGMSAS